MNIIAYVKSLKGVTDKDEVLRGLDNVEQDLASKTMPILNTAAAAFKTLKPKSEVIAGYEEAYRNDMKVGRNGSIFEDMRDRLIKMGQNLTVLRQEIQKTMPETVSQVSIDQKTATLMQLVDNASFVTRFVRRYIELFSIYETQETGIYEDYQKNNITKGEADWVNHRFPYFTDMLMAFSDSDFKKKFDAIPNVKVDADADNNNAMFGMLKLDPFKMGFIPVSLNPFFRIGRWIAEFQAWRYKEAQEDLKRIQQRILLLEEAQAGKSNPKIEKELELLRDKSEGLIYKINKAEEEMA